MVGDHLNFIFKIIIQLNIIANDKFTPLYNFWNSCKLDKKNICKELTKKLGMINKEDFTNLRVKIMDEKN